MRIINFMGLRNYGAIFSIIVMLISIGSLATRGLNFGLDFTGGTLVEVKFVDPVVPEDVRISLANAGIARSGRSALRIRARRADSSAAAEGRIRGAARRSSAQRADGEVPGRARCGVPNSLGRRLARNCAKPAGWRCSSRSAAVMVYMMFRFTSKFGIGAVVALIHDVVVTVGAFSVFQWTFDLPTLAAVLAVIGYSVNDTVVVADRIRENFRKLRKGTPLEIVNLSLTQTLDRTIDDVVHDVAGRGCAVPVRRRFGARLFDRADRRHRVRHVLVDVCGRGDRATRWATRAKTC